MATKRGFTVSFPEYEKHILEFIQSQPNPSAFVRRAVEFFMTGGGSYPPAPLNYQLVPLGVQFIQQPTNNMMVANNNNNNNMNMNNGSNSNDTKIEETTSKNDIPVETNNLEEQEDEKRALNTKVRFKKANEIEINDDDADDYDF